MSYFGSYFAVATYPAAANVRANINRGDGTLGTLVVPPAAAVLAGVTFDATTAGTVTLPSPAAVQAGVAYGPAGADVGTYSPAPAPAVAAFPPVAPAQVTGELVATDAQGNPWPGAVYTFRLTDEPAANGGSAGREPFKVTAGAGGLVTAEFIVGCTYVGWPGNVQPLWEKLVPFTAPASPFAIPLLLAPGFQ